MLRATRFLIPSIVISLTILGLATIYSGGCMDARAGEGNQIKIVGSEGKCD